MTIYFFSLFRSKISITQGHFISIISFCYFLFIFNVECGSSNIFHLNMTLFSVFNFSSYLEFCSFSWTSIFPSCSYFLFDSFYALFYFSFSISYVRIASIFTIPKLPSIFFSISLSPSTPSSLSLLLHSLSLPPSLSTLK